MPRKKAETPAAAPEEKVKVDPQEEMAEEVSQKETTEDSLEAGTESQAAPEEDSPGETAPVGRPAVVRSPKGLNLREGPSLCCEVLEVLLDGLEVKALDLPMGAEVPGWRLVYTGKRTGWVQSRFLRLEG